MADPDVPTPPPSPQPVNASVRTEPVTAATGEGVQPRHMEPSPNRDVAADPVEDGEHPSKDGNVRVIYEKPKGVFHFEPTVLGDVPFPATGGRVPTETVTGQPGIEPVHESPV